MRAAPVVATVALLVVAGCGAVGPSPTPDTDPGPTAETTTASPDYPPGVTANRLRDPEKLVAAHTASVREVGALLTSNGSATIVVAGEPRTVEFDTTAWSSPSAARVYYVSNNVRVGGNGTLRGERVQVYADDTTIYTRYVLDGNVASSETYPRGEHGDLVSLHVARTGFVRRVLRDGSFDTVQTERRNGETVTILKAFDTEFTDSGRRVLDATLVVTAEGRIRSLSVRRNPDANTAPGRRITNVSWSSPPDPQPPDWVT